MPQRASVFCNFYIRVDREALVSERALDVGSVAFKAMSTKNFISYFLRSSTDFMPTRNILGQVDIHTSWYCHRVTELL
jgi:hypothetical protein